MQVDSLCDGGAPWQKDGLPAQKPFQALGALAAVHMRHMKTLEAVLQVGCTAAFELLPGPS